MNSSIRAVIFTHGPDYAKAAIATRSLQCLGVEVCWAIDENETVEPPPHIHSIRTSFPRDGNLNGVECVIGILRVLKVVGEGARWVIKVDSDSMVLSLEWLLKCKDPLVGMYHEPMRGPHGLFGFCYAYDPPSIDGFIMAAEERGETEERAEDMVMGELGAKLGCCRHSFHHWTGVYSAWAWETRLSVSEWVPRYEVIVVQPQKGLNKNVARMRVAERMEEIFNAKWS